MSTETAVAVPFADVIPPDVMADAQVVADCVAAGRPIPDEVVWRVRAESDRIRAEVYRTHGVLDIGVPAIRELRGDLPE